MLESSNYLLFVNVLGQFNGTYCVDDINVACLYYELEKERPKRQRIVIFDTVSIVGKASH